MHALLRAVARTVILLALFSSPALTQSRRPLPGAAGSGEFVLPLYGSRRGEASDGCGTPSEYRAIDFLHGRWYVRRPDGTRGGSSVISSELEGCATVEHFAGGEGRSLTVFDARTRLWYQDYVDVRGLTLRLIGERTRDSLLLRDSVRSIPQGPSLASRFSWTPHADGVGFRQRWWFSQDSGKTEHLNFDGTYLPDTTTANPMPASPASCRERPAYRALDDILGEWTVTAADNTEIGTVSVTLQSGDCLLEERFSGRDGYRSIAFIYFDRYISRWHRVQADTRGTLVRQAGQAKGGVLDLVGTLSQPQEVATVQLQVRASPNSITQIWRVAKDSAVLNWKRR